MKSSSCVIINWYFRLQQGEISEKSDGWALDIYVFSPRPLDDLLIEPNMPKLTLVVKRKRMPACY